MSPENENYLEGLRDEDRQKQLDEVLARRENDRDWIAGASREMHTRNNWDEITPKSTERELPSLEDRILGVRTPAKQIPNEGDFLPGLSTQDMYPIKADNYNISQQLVGHVDRLSAMQARRPPKDYAVKVQSDSHSYGATSHYADLIHTPTNEKVGHVYWEGGLGHVDSLDVDVPHRHMTNYLITQAWNHSRARGENGPAGSHLLSHYSEKIVHKYNPDSVDFKRFQASKEGTCTACGGDGTTRLMAEESHHGGAYVNYVSSVGGFTNHTVPNTSEGRARFTQTVAHVHPITWQGGGRGIFNPETGDSHWWHDYEEQCTECGGSGERQAHQ